MKRFWRGQQVGSLAGWHISKVGKVRLARLQGRQRWQVDRLTGWQGRRGQGVGGVGGVGEVGRIGRVGRVGGNGRGLKRERGKRMGKVKLKWENGILIGIFDPNGKIPINQWSHKSSLPFSFRVNKVNGVACQQLLKLVRQNVEFRRSGRLIH